MHELFCCALVLPIALAAAPAAAQWFAQGEFNGWSTSNGSTINFVNPFPMVDLGGGHYTVTIGDHGDFFDNQPYEYKIGTSDWATSVPATHGRVTTDASGQIRFHFWDITTWDDGWMPNNQRRVGYEDHGQFDWEVMGSFDDWFAPLTLVDVGGGLHRGTFAMNAGTHEFKFRAQNDWSTTIGRDFGNYSPNNVIRVGANGDPWTFELDLPNGRWRAFTDAPPPPPDPPTFINGSRVGDRYGSPLAVQTVNTSFGDHDAELGHKGSELNAAYARVVGDKLHLMLTGNLEDNFNKLVLFFDSKPGGQNVIDTDESQLGSNPVFDPSPGAFDPGMFRKMKGTTFDVGFSADYAVVLRHGFTGAIQRFDVDYAVVGGESSQYLNVFDPTVENHGVTGVGANALPIEVGFDNSNSGGVGFGTEAADPAAAAAVDTGVEIAISLADLGAPAFGEEIKVMAFINSSNHDFASNQFLGGLAAPQDSLGSDSVGTFFPNETFFNLPFFAGEQYFTVPIVPAVKLPGDYNEDGQVDAADYTVWRDNNGAATALPNDDTPGVDDDDYERWKLHFGESLDDVGDSPAVPEPATGVLVYFAIVCHWVQRKKKRGCPAAFATEHPLALN